jgi:hypothetical protein
MSRNAQPPWDRWLEETIAVVAAKRAKGKYKPEIVRDVLEALARTGSDKAAYSAAGIGRATFYGWLGDDRYSEFSEGVARAREEYRLYHRPETVIEDINRALRDYAAGRMQEVWRRTTENYDRSGELTGSTVSTFVKTIPCPNWVVERVLGPVARRISVLDACNILLQHGLLTNEQVLTISNGLDSIESDMRLLSQKHSGTLADSGAVATLEALSK